MENFKKYLAEMFGTMFLVLLACGSAVLAGPSIGGLGIGSVSVLCSSAFAMPSATSPAVMSILAVLLWQIISSRSPKEV